MLASLTHSPKDGILSLGLSALPTSSVLLLFSTLSADWSFSACWLGSDWPVGASWGGGLGSDWSGVVSSEKQNVAEEHAANENTGH